LSHPDDDSEIEASRAPLMEHLVELRRRLIACAAALAVGFFFCFYFSQDIYFLLLRPFEVGARLLAAQKAGGSHGSLDLLLTLLGLKAAPAATQHLKLVFTAPLEFFFTKVKLAGFGAVVIAFPVLAWQLYAFVAPGLYKRERRAFRDFLGKRERGVAQIVRVHELIAQSPRERLFTLDTTARQKHQAGFLHANQLLSSGSKKPFGPVLLYVGRRGLLRRPADSRSKTGESRPR